MFNEGSMYGTSVVKRDDKNRVFMPSYTGAEKDDCLVIVKYQNFYKVLRRDVLDAKLKVIEDEIMNLVRHNNISSVSALEQYRDKLIMDVVRMSKVDGQGRIVIGDIYSGEKSITLVGAKDALYLMNEDAYVSYNEQIESIDQSVKTR